MNHSRNLNIHYSSPAHIWDELKKIYQSMPNWIGYHEGFPYWYGSVNDDKYLTISVEPSGLQVFGNLEQEEFENWLDLLKDKASHALEYQIGEPEDGFDFKFYD